MKAALNTVLVFMLSLNLAQAANTNWQGYWINQQNTSYISMSPNWQKVGKPYRVRMNNSSFDLDYVSGLKAYVSSPTLSAIDLSKQGKVLWQHDSQNNFNSELSIGEKAIYQVVLNDTSLKLSLKAYDISSGKSLFKTDIPAFLSTRESKAIVIQSAQHIYTIIYENIMYKGSVLRNISAFNKQSGALLWNQSPDLIMAQRPAISNNSLFMITRSKAYKINGDNGDITKELAIPLCYGSINESPRCLPTMISEDSLIYTSENNLYEIDMSLSNIERITIPTSSSSEKVLVDKKNIYTNAGEDLTLKAYDKKTHQLLWTHPLKSAYSTLWAVTDNAIITYDNNGLRSNCLLDIISTSTGKSIHFPYDIEDHIYPIALTSKGLIFKPSRKSDELIIYPFNN